MGAISRLLDVPICEVLIQSHTLPKVDSLKALDSSNNVKDGHVFFGSKNGILSKQNKNGEEGCQIANVALYRSSAFLAQAYVGWDFCFTTDGHTSSIVCVYCLRLLLRLLFAL